uniref:Uncharacterized protein n=1 Tax=Trichogramma kaykai TaxID=54128 RepID=A0ABD2X3P5_9HYME
MCVSDKVTQVSHHQQQVVYTLACAAHPANTHTHTHTHTHPGREEKFGPQSPPPPPLLHPSRRYRPSLWQSTTTTTTTTTTTISTTYGSLPARRARGSARPDSPNALLSHSLYTYIYIYARVIA